MVLREQYTAPVSQQYKQQTQHRKIRYTIQENFAAYPEVKNDFEEWYEKQTSLNKPNFVSVMHEDFPCPLFDIRNAEIREDWGQRNALLEASRKSKILGMAKNFDVKLFEPISVDYIRSEKSFIIRDGGGRAHASFLNGVYEVPAFVRYVDTVEESRRLFITQDKNAQAISGYDKFLQHLANPNSNLHAKACDTFAISRSCGICLSADQKSTQTPLVEGIGIFQKIIHQCGGDLKGTKWGQKQAPNISRAIDVLKESFPNNDEIPVSVLFAFTAFIQVVQNRIPSGASGHERLVDFVNKCINSDDELININNWVRVLKFDSSNHYDTYGASALMRKWNEVFKNANKGRKPKGFYRFAQFEDYEIDIISSNIMTLARDESLYT